MISIVDYGCGNLGSIANMFRKLNVKTQTVSNAEQILSAQKLLLPGVGHFDHGMTHLHEHGLRDALEQRVLGDKAPLLGICLGMQLLLEGSEEGSQPGLGWVPGRVARFHSDEKSRLRIPHMGWSEVEPNGDATLFRGFEETPRFYFVHSYHAAEVADANIAAWCTYGERFACALQHENIYATQFHPEKSHRYGLHLLKQFAELAPCPSPA